MRIKIKNIKIDKMIREIDVIKVICHVANTNIRCVSYDTSIDELGLNNRERAEILIARFKDEFAVELTFFIVSSCSKLGDLINCVFNQIIVSENNFGRKEDDSYNKADMLSILEFGNGSEIKKLQSSLDVMTKKLKSYTAELNESSAPVEHLRIEKAKFMESVLPPTRKEVISVVNDVCEIIKDLSLKVGDSIQVQSGGIKALSEIMRKIVLLEADLYNLLSEGSSQNKESIETMKEWCRANDVNSELFENLFIKTSERVNKQRERLSYLKTELGDRIDFVDHNYKILTDKIEGIECIIGRIAQRDCYVKENNLSRQKSIIDSVAFKLTIASLAVASFGISIYSIF